MATATRKKKTSSARKAAAAKKAPSFRTVRKPAAKKKKKALTALSGAISLLILLTAVILAGRNGFQDEDYMEYGRDVALDISLAGFSDLDTKNNLDLVAYATQAWEHQWGYVWGTFGYQLTPTQLSAKIAQYPDRVGSRADFIRENWLGRRTVDCIGLIKSYSWFDPRTRTIEYAAAGMPDINADQMFEAAVEKGRLGGLFHKIPEIPGILVYTPGHIGIYIGDGYVIEARGTEYGVVKTKLSERGFDYWLKSPYITYYDT